MNKKSVRSLRDAMRQQVNLNKAAVREIGEGIKKIGLGISEQARKNADFAKEFFGY